MIKFLKIIEKYFVAIEKFARRTYNYYKLKRKVHNLIKMHNCIKLTAEQKTNIYLIYMEYGFRNINTSWHQFYYTCNGIFSAKYVPETLFYLDLEPKLNIYKFATALSDKNILDRLFPDIKQPSVIVKNINGFYYNSDEIINLDLVIKLCNDAGRMIIKPTLDTWGGNGVILFNCSNGTTDIEDKPLLKLLEEYKKNFIIQKVLIQHPSVQSLNESSLNTFRVMTYLKDEKAQVLSTVIRMGRTGSINDNSTTGGISCGVRSDGNLNHVGFEISGKKYDATDSGILFSDIHFSFVDKIHHTAIYLHKKAPYFRIISWDLAVDPEEEIVLIEYNICGQGINLHQLNNGPVLSDLLSELI